jgi:hypothetical protein
MEVETEPLQMVIKQRQTIGEGGMMPKRKVGYHGSANGWLHMHSCPVSMRLISEDCRTTGGIACLLVLICTDNFACAGINSY